MSIRRLFFAVVPLVLGVTQTLATEARAPLIEHSDPVALPSLTRVIFGFLLTVAIGIGAMYALRRFLARLIPGKVSTDVLKIVAQANVHAGLRLHVVEISGANVLVAESKNGVALMPMPARTADAGPKAP